MISFWRIFSLELLLALRSRTLPLLLAVSALYLFAVPRFVVDDGTAAGARELVVRFSLGGVFLITLLSLTMSATGALARERATHRLMLTTVRPVRYAAIALGKWLALSVAGALPLALAAVWTVAAYGTGGRCCHVLSPVLESPREEAEKMYEVYMADPNTPEEVKKAPKGDVIALLELKAEEHYLPIATNMSCAWRFPAVSGGIGDDVRVRMRFATDFDLRRDVRGVVSYAGFSGAITNITQAESEFRLTRTPGAPAAADVLSFANRGSDALMLRPRKDVKVLVPADGGGWNLVRATIELESVLALVLAFAVFLGAVLARPPAMFAVIGLLLVAELGPSALERHPDPLNASFLDRIGFKLTRVAMELTHPVSALDPAGAYARGECVERRETAETFAADFVLLPLVFALLSGLLIPLRPDETA